VRCYFNLMNARESIRDIEGLEVTDLDEARSEVFKAIKEVRAESGKVEKDWQGWRMEVVDEAGCMLLSIPLDPIPRD